MGFWDWFKKGKITPTNSAPLAPKGEKFKGFKITWPWPGDSDEDHDGKV